MVLGWEDGVFSNWKISINPDNPDELFATGGYLYHTLDGGNAWEKSKPDDGIVALYALSNLWSERLLYVSTSDSGIYRLKY